MFKVKMDKSQPYIEEVDVKKIKSKLKSVSVKLSKNVIEEMRKRAGLVSNNSDNAILYAYITKTLSE